MARPKKEPIKIAESAGKEVFLLPTGVVVCGKVKFDSRKHKKAFKAAFNEIDHHLRENRLRRRDVSRYQIRDLEDLYAEMTRRWQRTITVRRVRRLAEETHIRKITNGISRPFMSYVNRKWRRFFSQPLSDEDRQRYNSPDKLY